MSNFSLDTLAEGIRDRHLGQENERLVEKWGRTGLLRGLDGTSRENMARLLENQCAEVLREQSSISTGAGGLTSSGDLRGFSNIAFPIVRRVFGGLVANELVSIQPMSLPSGLLFYLDYTYGSDIGGDSPLDLSSDAATASTYEKGQSIYNNPAGKAVRTGSDATGGQYDLVGTTYSKVHSSSIGLSLRASGAFGGTSGFVTGGKAHATGTDGKLLQFDPQITNLIEDPASGLNGLGQFQFLLVDITTDDFTDMDMTQVKDISLFRAAQSSVGLAVPPISIQGGNNILNVRRLNQFGTWDGVTFTANPLIGRTDTNASLLCVVTGVYTGDAGATNDGSAGMSLSASYAIADSLNVESGVGSTLVIPSFESNFSTSAPSPAIPEIDIKVESIAVTATTRKLRARWSPELAQDLNAYHSLDAEVELTQILSEQVALEIDREILNDLLTEAKGANLYWSRAPGKFVNKETAAEVKLSDSLAAGPRFTGTVREWY